MIDRIIYTYKMTHIGHHKGFTDRGIDMMKLSVQSANKFYKTILYCDIASYKLFKLNKIPFDKIVVVDWLTNHNYDNFGLAKLETMLNQTEPYIHIDLDTIITNKIIIDCNYDIQWGYSEVDLGINTKYPTRGSGKLSIDTINYLYENYILVATKYESNNINNFDFTRVTNNSLIIVNNPYIIADVIRDVKSKCNSYKNIINSSVNMFIEQFMLYQLVIEKKYITSGILSESTYNDLSQYWVDNIKYDNDIFKLFINNNFIHIPQISEFQISDYTFIYEYLLNNLNLDDNRTDTKTYNLPII